MQSGFPSWYSSVQWNDPSIPYTVGSLLPLLPHTVSRSLCSLHPLRPCSLNLLQLIWSSPPSHKPLHRPFLRQAFCPSTLHMMASLPEHAEKVHNVCNYSEENGIKSILKSRVQENVQRLKNVRLRFSFWAHMLLSWVSVIIPGALKWNKV